MLEKLNENSVNYWNNGTEEDNIISHVVKKLNLTTRDTVHVQITKTPNLSAEITLKYFQTKHVFLIMNQTEYPNFKTVFSLKQ